MAAIDRCMTPWLFVGMHRPMYVPYPHKSNRIVGRHLQDILEDLFLERQVDLVMSGHVHLYARTCSVRRDHCRSDDDGGIMHVTVGELLSHLGLEALPGHAVRTAAWCIAASASPLQSHSLRCIQAHGAEACMSEVPPPQQDLFMQLRPAIETWY